jgi:hypothetical protein
MSYSLDGSLVTWGDADGAIWSRTMRGGGIDRFELPASPEIGRAISDETERRHGNISLRERSQNDGDKRDLNQLDAIRVEPTARR